MRLIPSPTPFPLDLYKSHQISPTTIATAMRKSFDSLPYTYATTLDNFPRASYPSRAHPHRYKYIQHQPIAPPSKYIIHHVDDSDNSDKSFLSMLNPFDCDSESSDDDDEDYSDEDEVYNASSSNEIFSDRKFLKLLKWKKKKKKKKKKLILFKLLLGILVFVAVKFLLKKAIKFFPAILSFVRRDELYHDGEHDLDRDVDFTKTSATDENFAEHRSLFPSSYEVEHKLIL